jgi:hypothetical protein
MKKLKLAVVMLLSSTVSSLAAGALAVGSTGDVARDGLAYAIIGNRASEDEARTKVLDDCRNAQVHAPRANARCEIIASFHDKCAAVALDPKNGTPGAGWAVANTLPDAKAQAIVACKATAGRDRRGFCKIDAHSCDGKAEP